MRPGGLVPMIRGRDADLFACARRRPSRLYPIVIVVPSPIRAVVFDLDGLMVNTEEVFHLTGQELLRRRGKVATQELFNAMMGRRAREAFAAMIDMMQLSDSIDDLQDESESIFDGLLETKLRTMPGLLKSGMRLPTTIRMSVERPIRMRPKIVPGNVWNV